MASVREREKIGVVIVDDEELARHLVREYLAADSDLEILAECANGFEAVKAVAELKPDLLVLDIQMPKLNGFEVLELIESDLAVIFVTAYDEYALRAFEVHAVDYLLKPISPERLQEAVSRAKQRLAHRETLPLEKLAATTRALGSPLERVLIRTGVQVLVIPAAKIDYLEAQDDYIKISSEGKNYLKQMKLSDLEAMLDAQRFVRVHRSYILNVERLERLELYAKDSRMAILRDGARIPVSRSGYAKLKILL